MLYDIVLQCPYLKTVMEGNYDKFRKMMLEARRFDLSPGFAASVDQISDQNRKAWISAGPLIRPPANISWWETLHSLRPAHAKRPVNHAAGEMMPHRVGVLAYESQGMMCMLLFWSFPGKKTCEMSFAESVFDFTEFGAGRKLFSHFMMIAGQGDYAEPFFAAMNPFMSPRLLARCEADPALKDRFTQTYDWDGEARFWCVAMMLLNSKNVAEAIAAKETFRHRQLVKKGHSPSDTFRTCRIRMDRVSPRLHASPHSGEADQTASLRAHFVRGHFKIRKHGIYWWSPFMRGDIENGSVFKRYIVGTKSPVPLGLAEMQETATRVLPNNQ